MLPKASAGGMNILTVLPILLVFGGCRGGDSPTSTKDSSPPKATEEGRAANYQAASELLAAVRAGDAAAVRSALQAGANPDLKDEEGAPMICIAAEKGLTDVAKILVEGRADLKVRTKFGLAPVNLSILGRHSDTAVLLINAGAEVNDGAALMSATHNRDLNMIKLLLDRGADLHFADDVYVRVAAKQGNAELVRFFLDRGADPRSLSEMRENALHNASYVNEPEVLEMLLAKHIEVNATQYTGKTALIIAASRGNLESVKTLLAHGADPNITDDQRKTALDYSQPDGDIQRALRAAGAR